MAWFRRKSEDSDVLPELEQYYEAERRERAGLSWLLALVSVACVALVIITLFFSGKWLYGRLTKDNSDTTTAQTESQDQPTETADESTEATPATSTPVTAPPVTETPKTTPSVTPSPIVATAPAATKLTNTGPEGTLAAFALTVLVATYLRSLILKRKN